MQNVITNSPCPTCGSKQAVETIAEASGNSTLLVQLQCRKCGQTRNDKPTYYLDQSNAPVAAAPSPTVIPTPLVIPTTPNKPAAPVAVTPVIQATSAATSVPPPSLVPPLEALLRVALPDMYRTNPFRISELPVHAPPRDLARRQQMIESASKMGMAIPAGTNRLLPLDGALDPTVLREALQRLGDPEQRLMAEFFWFWAEDLQAPDEALALLIKGDVEAARALWQQRVQAGSTSVALHNLAVLSHCIALDLELAAANRTLSAAEVKQRDENWGNAYRHWKACMDEGQFWERLTTRVQELDDPRLTSNTVKQLEATLPQALLSINAKLAFQYAEHENTAAAQRHAALMQTSGFNQLWIDEALQNATEPIRSRVKTMITNISDETRNSAATADKATIKFYEQTKPILKLIDTLLIPTNQVRIALHDEIASCALATLISYGNETKDWPACVLLLDQAIEIASGGAVRARIEENKKTLDANTKYGTCWFCNKRPAVDAQAAKVKMYGDVKTTSVGYNRTQTTWRSITVNVPRCNECQEAHKRVEGTMNTGCLIFALPALYVAYQVANMVSTQWFATDKNAALWALCSGGIVLSIIAFIVVAVAINIGQKRHLDPIGVKPVAAQAQFPDVAELLKSGYQFGEKPNTNSK